MTSERTCMHQEASRVTTLDVMEAMEDIQVVNEDLRVNFLSSGLHIPPELREFGHLLDSLADSVCWGHEDLVNRVQAAALRLLLPLN